MASHVRRCSSPDRACAVGDSTANTVGDIGKTLSSLHRMGMNKERDVIK